MNNNTVDKSVLNTASVKPKVLLDDAPLSKFHIKIAGLTFGAHFTDGYILGIIGFALTILTPQMGLNALWTGLIGSSALIGLFIGSLVLGWISDHIGRQKIFVFSFILITVASFLQFFADSAIELVLLRILLGIGLGGDYSVGHTMLAEIAPRKQRGVLLGSFSVIWTVGYVCANIIGIYFADSTNPDIWKWLLASSTIPAIIILLLRIGTPESPRWLESKGRIEEGQAIVSKHLGENIVLDRQEIASDAGFKLLFSRKYIKRTVFNCIFWVTLVIPYFAIYTFLPLILESFGMSSNHSTDFLLNIILLVGAFLGIYFTAKFSRRGFLIWSFVVLAAMLGMLALLPSTMTLLLVAVFGVFTLIMSAVSNLVGVFPAESFPTEIRSSGVGLATSVSRFGSAAGTFLLPLSIANLGIQSSMLILVAVLLVGLVVSVLWAPETKNLTLNRASKD